MAIERQLDLYPSDGKRIRFGDLKELAIELAREGCPDDAVVAVAVNLEFRKDGLSSIRRLSVIRDDESGPKRIKGGK